MDPIQGGTPVAPGFGIVAGDFDGDSNADLYFVQNFYGPQAETAAWRVVSVHC